MIKTHVLIFKRHAGREKATNVRLVLRHDPSSERIWPLYLAKRMDGREDSEKALGHNVIESVCTELLPYSQVDKTEIAVLLTRLIAPNISMHSPLVKIGWRREIQLHPTDGGP